MGGEAQGRAKVDRRPKTCPWPLLSEAQVTTASPSRRDGMSQQQENSARSSVVTLIKLAGEKLRMSSYTIATAIVFWHRYFALKSLKRNDRFIMALAALFLAGKAEDEPKALNDIIYQCWKIRYKNNPVAVEQVKDRTYFESIREVVLTAERAMLYALGFQFYIHHPYYTVLEVVNKLAKHENPEVAHFWQKLLKDKLQVTWNFVNDSYRTTLCLQHDMRFIGVATVDLTLAILKLKAPLVDDKLWWQASCADLTADHLELIKAAIMSLYDQTSTVTEEAPEAAGASQSQPPEGTSPAQHASASGQVANGPSSTPTDAVARSPAPGPKRHEPPSQPHGAAPPRQSPGARPPLSPANGPHAMAEPEISAWQQHAAESLPPHAVAPFPVPLADEPPPTEAAPSSPAGAPMDLEEGEAPLEDGEAHEPPASAGPPLPAENGRMGQGASVRSPGQISGKRSAHEAELEDEARPTKRVDSPPSAGQPYAGTNGVAHGIANGVANGHIPENSTNGHIPENSPNGHIPGNSTLRSLTSS